MGLTTLQRDCAACDYLLTYLLIMVVLCGNFQVVCERTPWEGGYIGINSFGFGGSNVHVLLRSPDTVTTKHTAHEGTTATRLVTCASRTKEGVETLLAEMTRRPTDVDMQYLLQSSVGDLSALTHPYRGAGLLNADDNRHTVQVEHCTSLVFSRLTVFM